MHAIQSDGSLTGIGSSEKQVADFFAASHERHGWLVHDYCFRKCSQIDRRLGLHEDITNEVFLGLWKAIENGVPQSLQKDSQLIAFVLRIAKSRLTDRTRYSSRLKRTNSLEFHEHVTAHHEQCFKSLVSDLELNESWDRFERSLSVQDQEIVRMRRFGSDTKDIACMLQLTPRNVQRRLEKIYRDWCKESELQDL
jgi:RNA polymerase sigma factor (sigma-70 family)